MQFWLQSKYSDSAASRQAFFDSIVIGSVEAFNIEFLKCTSKSKAKTHFLTNSAQKHKNRLSYKAHDRIQSIHFDNNHNKDTF